MPLKYDNKQHIDFSGNTYTHTAMHTIHYIFVQTIKQAYKQSNYETQHVNKEKTPAYVLMPNTHVYYFTAQSANKMKTPAS